MPVTVKYISLWRKEVENQVGALARALEPVAKAGADLHPSFRQSQDSITICPTLRLRHFV